MKTTQPKKRGRPVGSTKEVSQKRKDLMKAIKEHNRDPETGEQTTFNREGGKWDWEPDSYDTVEQVNSWVKFSIKNDDSFLSTDGYVIVKDINSYVEEGRLYVEGKQPTNYWKYACVAIILGLVAGMILATPSIINLAEVCSQ